MSWTPDEIEELKRLHHEGKYFFTEIAQMIGKKPANVNHQARRLGLKQSAYVISRKGQWNSQHKHLREPVMKYFVTHTWDETRERFGLSDKQLKSIFTVGYRDPKFKRFRKDKRRHDAWTKSELLFLVKHSGIKPREWIARRLKRGTMQSTKECLFRLKISSRYINGLPERLANLIIPIGGIKTQAGAPGVSGECHIRIVPWVALEDAISGKRIKQDLRLSIQGMARFQRWVFGMKTNRAVIQKIKEIADE